MTWNVMAGEGQRFQIFEEYYEDNGDIHVWMYDRLHQRDMYRRTASPGEAIPVNYLRTICDMLNAQDRQIKALKQQVRDLG